MELFLDTETFSAAPISRGLDVYFADPSFELMVVTFALDRGPVQVWDKTADDEMPDDFEMALNDHNLAIVAQNANFDYQAMFTLRPTPITRWRCSRARALAHGLPGSLDGVSEALRLGEASKDKRGKELIQLFCKPRPAKQKLRRATRETHPKEWAEFLEYARQDVVAMRAAWYVMPRRNYGDAA